MQIQLKKDDQGDEVITFEAFFATIRAIVREEVRQELRELFVLRTDAKSDLKMSAGTIRLCLQISRFQAAEYDAQESYSHDNEDKRMFASAKKIAEAQANACRAMLVQIDANLKDEG